MGLIRVCHGSATTLLRVSCGFDKGMRWVCYGSVMGAPWACHGVCRGGSAMGPPWVCHRCTTENLRVWVMGARMRRNVCHRCATDLLGMCRVSARYLPLMRHVHAMLAPCACHAYATAPAMDAPWVCHGCAVGTPLEYARGRRFGEAMGTPPAWRGNTADVLRMVGGCATDRLLRMCYSNAMHACRMCDV